MIGDYITMVVEGGFQSAQGLSVAVVAALQRRADFRGCEKGGSG
jgi:hypothetical protein